MERPDISIKHVLDETTDADLVVFAGCMTPQGSTIEFINTKINAGGKPTKLLLEKNLEAVSLVNRD